MPKNGAHAFPSAVDTFPLTTRGTYRVWCVVWCVGDGRERVPVHLDFMWKVCVSSLPLPQFAGTYQEAALASASATAPVPLSVTPPPVPAAAASIPTSPSLSADPLKNEEVARRLFDACLKSSKTGTITVDVFVDAVQGTTSPPAMLSGDGGERASGPGSSHSVCCLVRGFCTRV